MGRPSHTDQDVEDAFVSIEESPPSHQVSPFNQNICVSPSHADETIRSAIGRAPRLFCDHPNALEGKPRADVFRKILVYAHDRVDDILSDPDAHPELLAMNGPARLLR